MTVGGTQEYNIFTAIWDNLQSKRVRKLRFAKCDKCNRYTPYKLIDIKKSFVICKNCENQISIINYFPQLEIS
jgi:ssDNA-binding Zn-finger/Zn-ribbon topoisomerase 1